MLNYFCKVFSHLFYLVFGCLKDKASAKTNLGKINNEVQDDILFS